MLFRKLWRTMGQYRAQFISMVIMIALGIGIFVGFNMEWKSIEVNVFRFFDDTGLADYRIVDEAGFTEDALSAVEEIAGVDAASRYLSVAVDVKERPGDMLGLSVTENAAVSGLLVMEGEAYDARSADGIWLSDTYAAENDVALGDELTLVYRNLEIRGTVRGLIKSGEYMICVRDSTQLMPDFTTYGFAYISPVLYEDAMGFAYYPQINVRSDLDKKAFTAAADEALGKTTMILTKDETVSYAEAMGEAEEGKTMGSVMPVLFLLIAVLTMVTTMHRLTAKEKTQIGTLKALGFSDRRILRHYTSYAMMIGVIGTVLGVGLGYFIAWYIMNPNGMMGTYFDMPEWKLCMPGFCYGVLAAILVLLTLIGYLSVRQMLRGTAADALRPYTPKRIKPLLLERTRLWEHLGFGARWNLRDVMRHKSRTLMTLIGTVGCALLISAALGMSDTMDAFLKLYYDEATNYASRIDLAQTATAAQRDALVDRYGGDYSATVAVQLEDKAVALDVYHTPHDKVRFPDRDNHFQPLSDSGAYLCIRLCDEFDLREGDTFTVSPYGSDAQYTLTVAGVVRSLTESIVITPAYADRLGIDYLPDTVYTDTEKADIPTDDAIAGVQSKQAIVDSFDSFMAIMDLMIVILVLAAILLGVVVLYNLGVMSYTERYREMATLKVVGFRDRKIGRLLIGQNLWISLLGVVLGIPLGVATLEYLLAALASEYELKSAVYFRTYLISILLTVGMSLLVSLLVARKNRKIDMVEALKGAE